MHVAFSQFDYYLGKPVDAEDPNGIVSSLYYNDALDRSTQVRRAVSTGATSQTTFAYDDVNRIVTTSSDRDNFGDNISVAKTLYDGLGRTTETRQYEGGSNYIVTETQYDALGRPYKTSNPYRPWQSETAVWTNQAFDALGRLISVTTPDNAVVSTSYNSNSVTVTDQAGKKRKSVTDALGRLLEVYEDPNGVNYQTTYTYDVLDNLVKVTQGSQQRFFMYDSLKRLLRARNPEQGTDSGLNLSDPITGNSAWSTGYQYDSNSNLTVKTDARGVVSTYTYDELNRNISFSYSDGTMAGGRAYDQTTNGKGRLSWEWQCANTNDCGSVTSFDYDTRGRVANRHQQFWINGNWGPPYSVHRAYDLAGNVASQTYPSGHTVNYSYDSAGRTSSFSGDLGDGVLRTYARGNLYSPWGSLSRETYGTSTAVHHKLRYNVRGQLCDVRASNVDDPMGGELGALVNYYSTTWAHCGSGTDNNGNVLMSQTIINSYYMEDRYSYDALNRLTAVNEWQNGATHTGSQQYDYDRWGNRTIKPASWGVGINNKQFTVDTATNRLTVPGGQSGVMNYDATGNLINDTYTGAGSREYDAENRMTRAWGGNNQWQSYTYNADGQRTRRKVNNQETWQIYGFEGELLAEYAPNGAAASPQKEYGYRNGQLLITAEAGSGSGGGQNVNWTNVEGVSVSGNNLTKTAGTDWYNARASSTQAITSGEGYVEFTASETTTNRMLGLGEFGNNYYTYSNIRYAIYLAANVLYTSEYGALTNVGSYATGDKLRVAIEGGAVKYYKNGALLRTSSIALTYPLYANVALYQNGSTLTGAVINNGSGSGSSAQINWLVADHLGTPRMIIDQTGTLANVKRHDYLPFGEELFSPTGGRSTALGYASADGVRQQFTQKERDIETGLDYFGYRYFAPAQGRWTSTDPLLDFERNIREPQAWNLYQYCVNSPLVRTDPDGRQDSIRLNGSTALEQQLRKQGYNEQQIKVFMEEYRKGQERGVKIAVATLAAVVIGPDAAKAFFFWAARNPDKVEQAGQMFLEGAGGPPGLTVSAGTRLTASEISTGVRLAEQTGLRLSESAHVGAEFVGTAGKTYDAMGSAAAYASKNWGNGSEFFKSVLRHVNKSVDYVAIDLKGASTNQISAIEKYVAGLTKEQQAKIIYVR